MKNVRNARNARNARNRDNKKASLYLMPALVSISILTMIPVLYTVFLSFTNKNLNHMDDYKLVGFSNYVKIIAGPLKDIFLPVFGWTFLFAGVTVLMGYMLGLFFALLLNNKHMKEKNIYKSLLILPWALPATIATLAWQGLLNQDYGGINLLLKSMHLTDSNIAWLTTPTLARLAVIVVSIWFTYPFMMNVCLGALQSIPETYYEAAQIDGANKFQQFLKITLPSLASSSYPLIISSFAMNFNNFGAVYLITEGGPPVLGGSLFAGSTDILASAAYKMSMLFFRYDYAGALAVLIFAIVAGISFVNMKLSGQFEEVN